MTLISEVFLNKYRYFTATPSITHEYIFVQYMTGIADQQDNPAQKDIEQYLCPILIVTLARPLIFNNMQQCRCVTPFGSATRLLGHLKTLRTLLIYLYASWHKGVRRPFKRPSTRG